MCVSSKLLQVCRTLCDPMDCRPTGHPRPWDSPGKNTGVGSYALPEKAMAPHSSTLAWRIPWMEEPGGLQSMGSRRVGHD